MTPFSNFAFIYILFFFVITYLICWLLHLRIMVLGRMQIITITWSKHISKSTVTRMKALITFPWCLTSQALNASILPKLTWMANFLLWCSTTSTNILKLFGIYLLLGNLLAFWHISYFQCLLPSDSCFPSKHFLPNYICAPPTDWNRYFVKRPAIKFCNMHEIDMFRRFSVHSRGGARSTDILEGHSEGFSRFGNK